MRFHDLKTLYRKLPFVLFLRFIMVDIARKILMPRARYYFAQGGEDIQCLYLLNWKKDGFYLDIGSNEPVHYSNTFRLYLYGWAGILVDGNKKLIDKATTIRKKDICLHAVVSNEVKEIDFYLSGDDLTSSVNYEYAFSEKTGANTARKITMQTVTLDQIIQQHVPAGKQISLLSIDVEGHDFEVLQSIDLKKHRPSMILIEDIHHQQTTIAENSYFRYLTGFDYYLAGMDKQNLYFISKGTIS